MDPADAAAHGVFVERTETDPTDPTDPANTDQQYDADELLETTTTAVEAALAD